MLAGQKKYVQIVYKAYFASIPDVYRVHVR